MNCPGCGRTVPRNSSHCPACGADLRDSHLIGSAILRPQGVPGGPDPHTHLEPALVDHEHTLRRLRTAWRLSLGGEGHLVSLVGENGSGRSRLIRELGATIDADAPQAQWLVGQAHSYATYQPLALIAGLLSPWSTGAAEADVPLRLATALATLADGAPVQERTALLALVRELRDGAVRAELAKLPLAEALAPALRRAAGDEPLVMVLEDLEWADAASLVVLDGLVSRLLAEKAMVLYTHHADWSHDWPGIARHAQLYLGSLSRADSLRLIAGVAGDQPLPAAVSEALAVGANGNPLLLEHATLAAVEANLDNPALVPTTIQAAIRARIAALAPTVRDVLLAGAILGERFAYRAVAMVTEPIITEPAALDAILRELTALRFIDRWREGPEVAYQFTHALIQEIAYGTIGAAERRRLDARVADWLLTEGALTQRGATDLLDDLDRLIAHAPSATAPAVVPSQSAPEADEEANNILPLPRGEKERAEVLARIVLADLPADRRASLVLCLEHGYTYAQAGEMLGLSRETVRAHLYEARAMFKRLHDASEARYGDRSTEGAR